MCALSFYRGPVKGNAGSANSCWSHDRRGGRRDCDVLHYKRPPVAAFLRTIATAWACYLVDFLYFVCTRTILARGLSLDWPREQVCRWNFVAGSRAAASRGFSKLPVPANSTKFVSEARAYRCLALALGPGLR